MLGNDLTLGILDSSTEQSCYVGIDASVIFDDDVFIYNDDSVDDSERVIMLTILVFMMILNLKNIRTSFLLP